MPIMKFQKYYMKNSHMFYGIINDN
jgi:hypothetical protein